MKIALILYQTLKKRMYGWKLSGMTAMIRARLRSSYI